MTPGGAAAAGATAATTAGAPRLRRAAAAQQVMPAATTATNINAGKLLPNVQSKWEDHGAEEGNGRDRAARDDAPDGGKSCSSGDSSRPSTGISNHATR